MKKIAIFLLLSLLVGMINVNGISFMSQAQRRDSQFSMHDHCSEMINVLADASDQYVNQKNKQAPAHHFCCSAFAVFSHTVAIFLPFSSDSYSLHVIAEPRSNIAESIYKPPRFYL